MQEALTPWVEKTDEMTGRAKRENRRRRQARGFATSKTGGSATDDNWGVAWHGVCHGGLAASGKSFHQMFIDSTCPGGGGGAGTPPMCVFRPSVPP